MARDLIVNGEAIYKLDVDPLSGAVRLLRATSYSACTARTLTRPRGATTSESLRADAIAHGRPRTAAEVLHVRYATLTGYPWRGPFPLAPGVRHRRAHRAVDRGTGPRGGGGRGPNPAPATGPIGGCVERDPKPHHRTGVRPDRSGRDDKRCHRCRTIIGAAHGIFALTGSASMRRLPRKHSTERCSWKSARSAACRGA